MRMLIDSFFTLEGMELKEKERDTSSLSTMIPKNLFSLPYG
jgi:hypothetical protein